MTIQNINKEFSALAEEKQLFLELKKSIEERESRIKNFMEQNDLESLSGSEHSASYKTIKSSRFDSKALEKANPKLYNEFVKETETKRFNFK